MEKWITYGMPKHKKTPLKTIGFRVYLYYGGEMNDTAVGTIALLDAHGEQTYGKPGQKTFNNWDEIPTAMRRLVSKTLGLRKAWKGKYWEYEKSKRRRT